MQWTERISPSDRLTRGISPYLRCGQRKHSLEFPPIQYKRLVIYVDSVTAHRYFTVKNQNGIMSIRIR